MVCWPVIVDPEPTDRDPDPNFKTQTVFKEIVSHANVHAGEVRFDHSNGRRRIECRQGEVRLKSLQVEDSSFTVPPET